MKTLREKAAKKPFGSDIESGGFWKERTNEWAEIVEAKPEKLLEITIPVGFYNCGVTMMGRFVCDSNNTKDFQQFSCPLPDGKWEIKSTKGSLVVLVDKS